jgi:hypothetical protein
MPAASAAQQHSDAMAQATDARLYSDAARVLPADCWFVAAKRPKAVPAWSVVAA